MGRFRKLLKRIFFLPALPTVLIALFGYAFVLLAFRLNITQPVIRRLAYLCSAYALTLTVTGFPHFIACGNKLKRFLYQHPLMEKFRGTPFGARYCQDIRFRSDVSLYIGLFFNLVYVGIKLFSGIYFQSLWFIALAVYYFVLAMMKMLLLRPGKRAVEAAPLEQELRRYRACGIMLLLMNQALVVIVVLIVRQNKGFDYPGLLIYFMALYSFYYAISACVKAVKYRKHGSPVMSAAKAITLVAAMVSILSLTTAMLARFDAAGVEYRQLMTSLVGSAVCLIVIGMAIYMIVRSTKQLKQPAIAPAETE